MTGVQTCALPISLLNDSQKEEELQVFIKENPMMLHPTAELIPKKKLGEDFITDFVLVTPNDQGPTYTLVEIEKSSHPILEIGRASCRERV